MKITSTGNYWTIDEGWFVIHDQDTDYYRLSRVTFPGGNAVTLTTVGDFPSLEEAINRRYEQQETT